MPPSVSLPRNAKRDIRVDPFALANATTVVAPAVPVTGTAPHPRTLAAGFTRLPNDSTALSGAVFAFPLALRTTGIQYRLAPTDGLTASALLSMAVSGR